MFWKTLHRQKFCHNEQLSANNTAITFNHCEHHHHLPLRAWFSQFLTTIIHHCEPGSASSSPSSFTTASLVQSSSPPSFTTASLVQPVPHHHHSLLRAWFSQFLFSSSTCSRRQPSGISNTVCLQARRLPVTQATASKHWMKHQWLPPVAWPHPFFIYHWTLEGSHQWPDLVLSTTGPLREGALLPKPVVPFKHKAVKKNQLYQLSYFSTVHQRIQQNSSFIHSIAFKAV